ncbi:hypothetical protein GOODEAATRI_006878, partial [Goodea atripinnis]
LRCVDKAFSTDVLSGWLTKKCVFSLGAGNQKVTNVPPRETFTMKMDKTAGTCENHSGIKGVFTDALTSDWIFEKHLHPLTLKQQPGKMSDCYRYERVNTSEQALQPVL